MAMNKKEKKLVEDLKTRLALRFTDEIGPDIFPQPGYDDLFKGYLFNSHTLRVSPACSCSVFHSRHSNERTDSQGRVNLYSNEIRALKSMRNEVEKECANKLRRIDAMIEEKETSA